MFLSIVIPVYNRPQEVMELLESLSHQSDRDFEVIIVEDGSLLSCEGVAKMYADRLEILYLRKENGGPGPARNFGSYRARGEYIVYLDSDCVVPELYTTALREAITTENLDAFGGPDRASDDFSDMQKAVSYSMTSFFTTGGIRGGAKNLDKFYPRSFNMGYSQQVFKQTGGFSNMRFGEDIDLSCRIFDLGFKCRLIPQAYVYHKRRTTMSSFFNQVFFSGIARINLYIRHPKSLKVVHTLPALFTVMVIVLTLLSLVNNRWALPLVFFALIWFLDSLIKNRSPKVAIMSVLTSFIQLLGYGYGFIYGAWARFVLKESEEQVNKTKFY